MPAVSIRVAVDASPAIIESTRELTTAFMMHSLVAIAAHGRKEGSDPPVPAPLASRAALASLRSVFFFWKAHGLQPHRWQQFKLSNDPKFVDKLRDVFGLYVDPPAHAIVL